MSGIISMRENSTLKIPSGSAGVSKSTATRITSIRISDSKSFIVNVAFPSATVGENVSFDFLLRSGTRLATQLLIKLVRAEPSLRH